MNTSTEKNKIKENQSEGAQNFLRISTKKNKKEHFKQCIKPFHLYNNVLLVLPIENETKNIH